MMAMEDFLRVKGFDDGACVMGEWWSKRPPARLASSQQHQYENLLVTLA